MESIEKMSKEHQEILKELKLLEDDFKSMEKLDRILKKQYKEQGESEELEKEFLAQEKIYIRLNKAFDNLYEKMKNLEKNSK